MTPSLDLSRQHASGRTRSYDPTEGSANSDASRRHHASGILAPRASTGWLCTSWTNVGRCSLQETEKNSSPIVISGGDTRVIIDGIAHADVSGDFEVSFPIEPKRKF